MTTSILSSRLDRPEFTNIYSDIPKCLALGDIVILQAKRCSHVFHGIMQEGKKIENADPLDTIRVLHFQLPICPMVFQKGDFLERLARAKCTYCECNLQYRVLKFDTLPHLYKFIVR